MKVEIVTITPEMAEEMLTHNYEGNRHVRTSYVSQLAHVCGVDHELIPLVFQCDYDTKQPTFYDKDGKPLQTVTKPQVVRRVG